MTHPRLRPLTTLLLLSALGSQAVAQKLVLAKLENYREVDAGQSQNISFDDYFRVYQSDPTATFTVLLPTLSGTTIQNVARPRTYYTGQITRNEPGFVTEVVPHGDGTARIVTLTPTDIQVRLLPDEVPNAVANFMTYAAAGAYENTFVHRNPGAGLNPASFHIAQGGGFKAHPANEGDIGEFQQDTVPDLTAVWAERGRTSGQYTLAGATTSNGVFSNQWYFNLSDNAGAFGNNYPVFGVVESNAGKAALDLMKQIPAYDMTGLWSPGSSLFIDVPLMVNSETTADGALDSHDEIWIDAFLRFSDVRLDDENRGSPASSDSTVTFSWVAVEELEDENNDGNNTNDNRYNYDKEAFQLSVDGGNLVVNALKPGMLDILLRAKQDGDWKDLFISLASVNRALTACFTNYTRVVARTDEDVEWNAYYTQTPFGAVYDFGFPYVYIRQYGTLWIDAGENSNDVNGFWAYDYAIGRWIWTQAAHPRQLYVTGEGEGNTGWVYTNLTQVPDEANPGATRDVRWLWVYSIDGQPAAWIKAPRLKDNNLRDLLESAQ
ncbi:MAG: peptidylprolyl isomerase [Verrucomicrobiota bacterium JB022]|nr:peptidylprolyl isomerase [Verrucomicrobiota bacterium JB022]